MDLRQDFFPVKSRELAIEAILFTMGKSVELRQICLALEISEKEALEALETLAKRYETDSALKLVRLEKSYQLCTKAEYFDILVKVAKTPKKQVLTEAVLETLSIIAYKQPITKAEIEKIRAVSSEYSVNKLVEYGLVYEAGRLEAPGRPVLFATTEEFLRRFGVESKKNLPLVNPVMEAEIEKEVEEEINYKFGFEVEEKNEESGDEN